MNTGSTSKVTSPLNTTPKKREMQSAFHEVVVHAQSHKLSPTGSTPCVGKEDVQMVQLRGKCERGVASHRILKQFPRTLARRTDRGQAPYVVPVHPSNFWVLHGSRHTEKKLRLTLSPARRVMSSRRVASHLSDHMRLVC